MFTIVERVIHKKSDEVIKKYVETLKKELFNEEEHPWMREDPLDGDNYQCDFNGQKVSLSKIFWRDESVRKENIIIICGKKHVGKSFFAEKILKACELSIYRGNLIRNKHKMYRIPILIEPEWFFNLVDEEKYRLDELILRAIEAKSEGRLNYQTINLLKEDINQLLAYGKFVIYFQDNEWIRTQDELAKVLKYGTVFRNYNDRTKFHNIVLLTSDIEGQIKDSFLNKNNCGYITLEKLSQQEVENYLSKRLSNFLEIAEKNDDVMKLLCYPEHLKMFEALCDRNMIREEDEINNKFDLYKFFIKAHISKNLNDKNVYKNARVDKICQKLQNYAWNSWINKSYDKALLENISRYFSFEEFVNCGLLEENGKFTFPYCGYYLVANNFLYKIKNNKEELKKLVHEIEEAEDLEIILSLISGMIKEGELEVFSDFWNFLVESSKIPLLLLGKILKDSIYRNEFQEYLFEEAFNHLKSEFYDYSVLEAFEELKPDCANHLMAKYLTLNKYDVKEQNNIKKRIVYYLGISHNGILPKMIEELLEDETEQHLKYHIIRAAVENYGEDAVATEIVNNNIDSISAYCYQQEDPIIKSDFELLYEKCKQEKWQNEKDRLQMLEDLESMLENDLYWIRAHAAGAIGRRNRNNASKLLLERIRKELQNIYDLNAGFRNSIKVISYSVEALCDRHERISTTEKNFIINSLVKMIDISKMNNFEIEDAYSTIATGIEYMINSNKDKLAFNLGGRFRNRTFNYKRVLLYIFEELINYYEDEGEVVDSLKEKCDLLKGMKKVEIKTKDRVKRIMHLSDWHLIEDNTYNNLIIMQLECFKPIDLLIITGDLKDFAGNYDKALANLKNLVKTLEIRIKDVFMVPGNHDANTIDNQECIYKEIRDNIYDNIECYREHKSLLDTAFDEYSEFIREFFCEEYFEHGGIHNKVLVWENVLQIVCINTALLCDSDSNKKKIVDTFELLEQKPMKNLPTIAISHHPHSEIHDAQKDLVEAILKELNISVLLSGDKHICRNETIGGLQDGIPNLIIGKNFKNNRDDHYSDVNICIYEVNFETMKLRPYLKKWEKYKFVPSFEFSYDKNNDGNYEIQNIDLLCIEKS